MPNDETRKDAAQQEAEQDEAMRQRAKEDPGAGFTRVKQERSRNTEFAQPPRPAGGNNPPEEP